MLLTNTMIIWGQTYETKRYAYILNPAMGGYAKIADTWLNKLMTRLMLSSYLCL